MGWVTAALRELKAGRPAHVRPIGGSMRGRIESGQAITICPVDPAEVKPDDVVLVEWKGNYLLHLVKESTADQLLIGNNLGKINGWVARSSVIGRVTGVHDGAGVDAGAGGKGPRGPTTQFRFEAALLGETDRSARQLGAVPVPPECAALEALEGVVSGVPIAR